MLGQPSAEPPQPSQRYRGQQGLRAADAVMLAGAGTPPDALPM